MWRRGGGVGVSEKTRRSGSKFGLEELWRRRWNCSVACFIGHCLLSIFARFQPPLESLNQRTCYILQVSFVVLFIPIIIATCQCHYLAAFNNSITFSFSFFFIKINCSRLIVLLFCVFFNCFFITKILEIWIEVKIMQQWYIILVVWNYS